MSKTTGSQQKPIHEFIDADDLLISVNKFVRDNEKQLALGQKYLILNPICLEYLNLFFNSKRISFTLKKSDILDLKFIISLIKYLKFNPNKPELLEKVKPMDLTAFEQLNKLEMTFIKPALITNLCSLSKNLDSISVHNALYSLDELLIVEDEVQLQYYNETSREIFVDVIDPVEIQFKRLQSLYKKNKIWSKLKKLDCSFNFIPKIDQSAYALTSLEELNLEGNIITKIENLHECINLTTLNLSYNRVSGFDHINELLGMITKLYLRGNGISSIEGIQKLYALEFLDLSLNEIKDIDEILKLKNLPHLRFLDVLENPLCDLKYYRQIILSSFFEQDMSVLNIKQFIFNHILITEMDLRKELSSKSGPYFVPQPNNLNVGKIKPIKDDNTNSVMIAPNAKISETTPSGAQSSMLINHVVDLEQSSASNKEETDELDAEKKPNDDKFVEETQLSKKLDDLRKMGGDKWLLILDQDDNLNKPQLTESPTPTRRFDHLTATTTTTTTTIDNDNNISTVTTTTSTPTKKIIRKVKKRIPVGTNSAGNTANSTPIATSPSTPNNSNLNGSSTPKYNNVTSTPIQSSKSLSGLALNNNIIEPFLVKKYLENSDIFLKITNDSLDEVSPLNGANLNVYLFKNILFINQNRERLNLIEIAICRGFKEMIPSDVIKNIYQMESTEQSTRFIQELKPKIPTFMMNCITCFERYPARTLDDFNRCIKCKSPNITIQTSQSSSSTPMMSTNTSQSSSYSSSFNSNTSAINIGQNSYASPIYSSSPAVTTPTGTSFGSLGTASSSLKNTLSRMISSNDISTNSNLNDEQLTDSQFNQMIIDDQKLQIFFRLNLYKNGSREQFVYFMKTQYLRYNTQEDEKTIYILLTTTNIYLLTKKEIGSLGSRPFKSMIAGSKPDFGVSDDGSTKFTLYQSYGLSEIRKVSVQLGYQFCRVELDDVCYILLKRCQESMETFVQLLFRQIKNEGSSLEPSLRFGETLKALEVLLEKEEFQHYSMLHFKISGRNIQPKSLILSKSKLYICTENYIQYPLLNKLIKTSSPQFQLEKYQKITDITSINYNPQIPNLFTLVFEVDENSSDKIKWNLIASNKVEAQLNIKIISSLWKLKFHADLLITNFENF